MSCLIAEPYGVALVQGDGGAEQGQDWLEADCAPTEAVGRADEQQFKELIDDVVGDLTVDAW